MTQCVNGRETTTSHHDGDGIRRAAYEAAMARFSGRRGLGRTMTAESRALVRDFDFFVVAGTAQNS